MSKQLRNASPQLRAEHLSGFNAGRFAILVRIQILARPLCDSLLPVKLEPKTGHQI
jgi:hypothetical protein